VRAPAAAQPILAVAGLKRYFDVSPPWLERMLGGGRRLILKAVDGVSFTVERGRTLALVGESGCGKSTVARCVTHLTPPTAGSVTFSFDGETREDAGALSLESQRKIQMIFQDPYASLNPRWTVARIVAEPIRAFGLAAARAEVRERVVGLLTKVGLSAQDAFKYPHEFSGGQRQRISIARALASTPAFLVCDEPTSALDVSVQAQILNTMKQLQEELHLTYLFISHDLSVVFQMSDRVGVMYLGRIVELRETAALFRAPLHPYTQLLLAAVPRADRIGELSAPLGGDVPSPIDPPTGCAFHPRCPLATARCRAEVPSAIEVEGGLVACHAVAEGRVSPHSLTVAGSAA